VRVFFESSEVWRLYENVTRQGERLLSADKSTNVDLEDISPTPQSTAVADSLRKLIGLGIFGSGDKLPPERELASKFGVGRMTLRAAIKQLNAEGLIKTTRGRTGGSTVCQPNTSRKYRTDYLQKCYRELQENYEFRQAIEPLAAALCAERATDKQKKRISEVVTRDPEGFDEYRKIDSQFHACLADFCSNKLVSEAVLHARTEFFHWADPMWIGSNESPDFIEINMNQHREIARAISLGKTTHAWNLMISHLHDAEENFVKEMEMLLDGAKSSE